MLSIVDQSTIATLVAGSFTSDLAAVSGVTYSWEHSVSSIGARPTRGSLVIAIGENGHEAPDYEIDLAIIGVD